MELRGEEKVAAATIAATLGLEVKQHDDGRRAGMHDLDILEPGGSTAAVEVTAAADADSIQLWKLVNGGDERWIVPTLRGGWMVALDPTARARRLLNELPDLLHELERRNIATIPRSGRNEAPGSIEQRARRLGIVSGDRSPTDFPGSIYLTIERAPERTGGIVDNSGSAVPTWVHNFLLDPHQADVLLKLARSRAQERHAFILIPGFSIAPFGVTDMLWRDHSEAVPTRDPQLPPQVTHIWLMSFWTIGSGLRWSPGRGWERFERRFGTVT